MSQPIVYCIITALCSVGLTLCYSAYWESKTKRKNNTKSTGDVGMHSVVDLRENETEEQSLKRLKKIYPDAWREYKKNSHIPLLELPDAIVQKTLAEYKNGVVSAQLMSYHLNFSNGLSLWIENRYYSFGNVCKSSDKRMSSYSFESRDGRLSAYTFMFLVDVVHELERPIVWSQLHTNYDRKMKPREYW